MRACIATDLLREALFEREDQAYICSRTMSCLTSFKTTSPCSFSKFVALYVACEYMLLVLVSRGLSLEPSWRMLSGEDFRSTVVGEKCEIGDPKTG